MSASQLTGWSVHLGEKEERGGGREGGGMKGGGRGKGRKRKRRRRKREKRVEERDSLKKRKDLILSFMFSLLSRRAEARAGLTSWAVPGEMGICP